MHTPSRFILAVLVSLPCAASAQQKPALTPADYGKWESLGPATLAPNGQWLVYAINRVNEENELRIRAIARDSTVVVRYATGPVFSPDSRWLAYSIGVSPTERARLERDKKPIRTSVGIRNVATGTEMVVADVASFRFSGDGRFLAMRGYPAEGRRTANLFVQDLAAGTRLTFGNVSAFSWSEPGALLALTVETETGVGNALQVYDAGRGSLKVLESSSSLYRAPVWRAKATDLAVLRTRTDKGFRDTTHVVLAFAGASLDKPVRRELDPASAAGFPKPMRIAEHRAPEWAKDGSTITVGLREREAVRSRADTAARTDSGAAGAPRDTTRAKAEPEKVSDVQIWHARDVRIMPQQKAQEQQDLQRTLPAVWHLAEGRVVPLGEDLLEPSRVLEGGRFAVETDATPYPEGAMFGREYQDVWLTDVKTGTRRKVLAKVRFFYGGSATGTRLLAYDGKDYIAVDVLTGAKVNLTAKIQGTFKDVDYDYPSDLTPPSGIAGWTKGDRAVLVYDQYDVWSLALDGSGGRRLTDGARDGIVHRFLRSPRDVDGIDTTKPMYFAITGKRSKKSGFARLVPGKPVEQIMFEDARVARLIRADSAEVVAFTRERFDDSPDWYLATGGDFASARQMSATNPFQKDYAWGRSEIVDFKSGKGRDLQGALFYPANYDASKKYPMIVYTYELLSQNVHNYVVPSERSYYNFSVFTANGYFVFTPDIVFTGREPGLSVLESVEPAVRTVIARGNVDSARVGIVGHSWGGYEATFLPTRTKIFAASVAGAPITNFLSFAGAIHWTPGIPEFSHWETGQARMDVPPWEDLEAYLRNSPIAKVHELETPMLMEVGDADGTVDWHQGIEFYNFARRAGRSNFILLVYPGEDHGLRKKENQIDYHRRILQWFGHYLKGEPAAKWMKEGMTWMDRKTLLASPPSE